MEPDAVIVEDPSVTLAYTSHPTINITSNSDFETQSWPGEGTSTSPYVISNLNITSEDQICMSSASRLKLDMCIAIDEASSNT